MRCGDGTYDVSATPGMVPRLPTAVLCAALGLASGGSFLSGVVLDSVSKGRQEQKRMAYLRYPSVQEAVRTAPATPKEAEGRSTDGATDSGPSTAS